MFRMNGTRLMMKSATAVVTTVIAMALRICIRWGFCCSPRVIGDRRPKRLGPEVAGKGRKWTEEDA